MFTLTEDQINAQQNRLHEMGIRLAGSPRWKSLCETIEDPHERSTMGLLLQNQFNALASADASQLHIVSEGLTQLLRDHGITETTRIINVGNFDKVAFPMIRAVFPNLIANDLVSVQPMTGPVGLVFFMDYLMGTTKGNQTAGTAYFDSRTGPASGQQYYSSAVVPNESLVDDGALTEFSANLGHTPVRPGTLSGSYFDGTNTQTFTDDGNGGLIGSDITAATSSINYATGQLRITSTAGAAAVPVTVTYEYDTEANSDIPEVNIQITSSPVVAQTRKLRANWSVEAAQNAAAQYGINTEQEVTAVMAEIIKMDIDQEVINDLYNFAQAGLAQWDKAVPPGIGYAEHKLSVYSTLLANSNQVYSATKRGETTWIVAGVDACTVFEDHPRFERSASAGLQKNSGIMKVGTLGPWTIYKNPFFPSAKWVMGLKGNSFLDSGYVYAPFVPFFQTPTVILDDFKGRKGTGTQYGKKPINARFYAQGEILNAS